MVESPKPVATTVPTVVRAKVSPWKQIKHDALRGGTAGAIAQVGNVFSLMWLRTTMNYQYRYGHSTTGALRTLWHEGGIPRFYRGLLPALVQSPMSRFGDAAANTCVMEFLNSRDNTRTLPVGVKTAFASCGAASFRLFLMPIDAWKTMKQVEGKAGVDLLLKKVKTHGPTKLYHGGLAAMGATWVGHYPWFFTYNFLNSKLPQFQFNHGKYVRNAMIGFSASVISDTCSNSIRVIKTTKQTHATPISYIDGAKLVVKSDGLLGLFGRGLKTRLLTNGLQGIIFTIGFRAMQERLMGKVV